MVITGLCIASALVKRLEMDPFDGGLSRFVSSRDRYAIWPMAVGAIVQVCVLVTHPPSEHTIAQPLVRTFKATFTEIVPIHSFGNDFLTGNSWFLIYALILAALLFTRKADGRARLIVIAFLAVAIIECLAPMLRVAELTPMYSLGAADRYFYLIKVVWWWAVWLALCSGSRRSHHNATLMTMALIGMVAVTNTQYLRRPGLDDLKWREHASVLSQPGQHTIPVNPGGWSITLQVATPERQE
jgi:hypothetical protein